MEPGWVKEISQGAGCWGRAVMERSWQRNFRAAEPRVPKAKRRESVRGWGKAQQHPVPVGDGFRNQRGRHCLCSVRQPHRPGGRSHGTPRQAPTALGGDVYRPEVWWAGGGRATVVTRDQKRPSGSQPRSHSKTPTEKKQALDLSSPRHCPPRSSDAALNYCPGLSL